MSSRPLAWLLAAGFSLGLAQSQSNSMLDGTKPPVNDLTKPSISLEMRGDIFMARKMYREAIDTFREGAPTDPVLCNKMGIAYHQMAQLAEARKNYERALKLKPDYVEAMNNLGTVHYALK